MDTLTMTLGALLTMDEFRFSNHPFKHTPRYNSALESKIPHPYWKLDRDSIQRDLKDISNCISPLLKNEQGLDNELAHVRKTNMRLDQVEHESIIKVALLGAQGAGKSLLINAIFDCPGLSLTGAKGFACTSAIIKYAYSPGDKFAAEVKFLNAKKREEMVDEHIRSYSNYHKDFEDSDDEGKPSSRSQKQDELERKQKQTAEDFFDTIFGSRQDFLESWSSSPVNTAEFKNLCQLKCKEAMDEFDMNSQDTIMLSKSTPKELLEVIKPFISKVKDKICLWPLVDCVTIRFNHELLKLGLEIIDLPGSGDTNILRTRHADEVKDSVDVEIILAPSDRIGTNEMLISTANAAVLNHGVANVKIIATKTDVLSDDDTSNCVGDIYEQVDRLAQQAEDDLSNSPDSENESFYLLVSRYKKYLTDYKKACMIHERAQEIEKILGDTLAGVSHETAIQIFHTSTAEYMNWIKMENIPFDRLPGLSPEHTGVPAIRRFLYSLPASNNLRDYIQHIQNVVPAFAEKLKRIVSEEDRDVGFVTIADDFDHLRRRYIGDLITQIKSHHQRYTNISIGKIKRDVKIFRESVNKLILNGWLTYAGPTFTRILKGRGTVPKGASKARGLERGVNWNQELASIMKPGFQNWHAIYAENLQLLKDALSPAMERLFNLTVDMMGSSAANLFTVERAKTKWKTMRPKIQAKLIAMMEEMMTEENRMFHRATLKDDRENNIIADFTGVIYDQTLKSEPELKSSATAKSKKYVTPIFKYRKRLLQELFFDNVEGHFVDRLIDTFEAQLEEKMFSIIDKHFERLNGLFNDFSTMLREHGPVAVDPNPMGQAIRHKLEEHIPYIESKVEALRALLPAAHSSDEDDADNEAFEDAYELGCMARRDLTYFLEMASKKKKKRLGGGNSFWRQNKRIKEEPA